MLDTITLRLQTPPIIRSKNNRVKLAPAALKQGWPTGRNVLIRYTRGRPRRVSSVSIENDRYHIEVYTNFGFIYIRFSVARVMTLGASNFHPVSWDGAEAVFDFVQEHLHLEHGFIADIRGAVVARIDIFGNAETRFSFSVYRPLFDLLRFRFRKGVGFETTDLRYNDERASVIYDKHIQQQTQSLRALIRRNTLRWELRYMNARTIQQRLDIITVDNLLEKWAAVRKHYYDQISWALRLDRRLPGDSYAEDYVEMLSQMRQELGGTKAFFQLIEALGTRELLGVFNSSEAVREVLQQAGFDKRKQIPWIMDKVAEFRSVRLPTEAVSINDLREELYTSIRTE